MLRFRTTQRPPRGIRRLAAVFAGLFALSYVGAAHHHAFVEHEPCEEHGELVHAHHGGDAPARPDARSHGDEPRAFSADPSAGGEHGEHHHCHIHPTSRAAAAAGCERTVADTSPPQSEIAPSTERVIGPSRALFALAPKTSPPAARDLA